jgi:hypothetical protein
MAKDCRSRKNPERINLKRTAFLALALALIPASVLAQPLPNPFQGLFSGTPQEQAACHPDAEKFCHEAGKDEFRVLACLQKNRTQISAGCRHVLESHGQ